MGSYLPVVEKRRSMRLATAGILYILRQNRKLQVVTVRGCHEIYAKMAEVEPYLDERFFACLQGLVINFDQVNRLEDQTVFFRGGNCLHLAQNCYRRTRQAYNEYMKKS